MLKQNTAITTRRCSTAITLVPKRPNTQKPEQLDLCSERYRQSFFVSFCSVKLRPKSSTGPELTGSTRIRRTSI